MQTQNLIIKGIIKELNKYPYRIILLLLIFFSMVWGVAIFSPLITNLYNSWCIGIFCTLFIASSLFAYYRYSTGRATVEVFKSLLLPIGLIIAIDILIILFYGDVLVSDSPDDMVISAVKAMVNVMPIFSGLLSVFISICIGDRKIN